MDTETNNKKQDLIYACGRNEYDIARLSKCYDLLANIHTLTQEIIKRHRKKEQIIIYIYGASVTGKLTAMVLDEYPEISVKGFFDKSNKLLSFADNDLKIFSSPRLPIYNPADMPKLTMDAIICSAAPLHYPHIHSTLQKNAPNVPTYFIHKSSIFPSAHPQKTYPPVLISTTGRCGTHWLGGILGFIFRQEKITEIKAYTPLANNKRIVHHDIFNKLQHNQYSIDHFLLTNELNGAIRQGIIKAAFLYRDPRDMQVSASYYQNQKFSFDLEFIDRKIEQIIEWQKTPHVHLIRYEDMKKQPTRTLHSFCHFLGINIDNDTLAKVLEANSFANLSGGRKPGQADPNHHYRKGIIGDWKNHFSQQNVQQIKNKCGDKLIKIGYEKDLNW